MPVRDEEAQGEAAVRAACAQAGEAEVVVLDDGSTDATPAGVPTQD
jgi:glycosyltransferase involved in cell wall biosynthesis